MLDGEIVIPLDESLSFDRLLMRIHPAASRVKKLSQSTPCLFIVFDLLVDDSGKSLVKMPLANRRKSLENLPGSLFSTGIRPFNCRPPQARSRWRANGSSLGMGLDGVVAKRRDLPYQSGERTGMQKIKNQRTAECVIGGFRYLEKEPLVGSLLLGPIRQRGQARSRRIHVVDSCRGSPCIDKKARAPHQVAGFHRKCSRRSEPLEHKALDRMATSRAEAGGGGAVRSLHGRPLPARNKVPALAPRQAAAGCTFKQVERENAATLRRAETGSVMSG